MADGVDPNHGFLKEPRRKTLLGPNSKKVPVVIAMTERAGSAGRTAPAHYAHFQPALLTGLGMTKRQHCRSKSLSLNKLFLFNPPLKKGDIGGFASGCLEKIPPHPPLQRGENYLRTSSKYQNVKSSLKRIGENCGLTAGENYIPRLLDQEYNSEQVGCPLGN